MSGKLAEPHVYVDISKLCAPCCPVVSIKTRLVAHIVERKLPTAAVLDKDTCMRPDSMLPGGGFIRNSHKISMHTSG